MTRRTIPTLFLASLLVALPTLAADRPPQDLHLVDDHWTAWTPPESFPEGSEVHVIERGDTLWDLAARFFGDPYLWPQIWERNQYILDAHWIYPGDPLLVSLEVTAVETLAELEPPETAEGQERRDAPEEGGDINERGILEADVVGGPPTPLGSRSDIYCSGFIGPSDLDLPLRIVGSEYGVTLPTLFGKDRRGARRNAGGIYGIIDTAKYGLSTGDIVYLGQGRVDGISPGGLYTVVSPRQVITHPLTGDSYGRLYRYQGRVRILSAQDETAIGEIVHSCAPIVVGDGLELFEPVPVPLARTGPLWPVNLPVSAAELEDAPAVIHAHGDVFSLGEDNVVYIDRGEDADIIPGDVFTIYRMNREGLPPVVLGELGILTVRDRSAVAKILQSRHTIYPGDRLVAK